MTRAQLYDSLGGDPFRPMPKGWQRVIYKSVYSSEELMGCLKPNGDVVGWFNGIIPGGWLVLSRKNEVKEIVKHIAP